MNRESNRRQAGGGRHTHTHSIAPDDASAKKSPAAQAARRHLHSAVEALGFDPGLRAVAAVGHHVHEAHVILILVAGVPAGAR